MREDPVFSGGFVKAALVVLVAAALGFGGYALAGGGVDIDLPDLPDLPEIDTAGDGATNLENTTLEDTTIDGPGEQFDPFTTASFSRALDRIGDEAGGDAELTRVFINEVQTQAIVRRGDEVEAVSVRAENGEVSSEEATITISGNATIDDFAFSLAGIDPGAVDRMLASARERSGAAAGFEPTVLSLERAIPFGNSRLEWTINAQAGGRNLLYRADAKGGKVRNEGGEGTEIPPAAVEAQKLNDCIQAAEGEPERIFACLEQRE